MSGEREVWTSLLKLSPRDPARSERKWMDGSSAYLPVTGELHSIDPRVDIKAGKQQLSRLCRVQRAQRALTVVSEPSEGVHAVASVLPHHLHQPLLVQSPDRSHWVVSPRAGHRTQGLLSTEKRQRQRGRRRTESPLWSAAYPRSP